jgi:hypothetical protein
MIAASRGGQGSKSLHAPCVRSRLQLERRQLRLRHDSQVPPAVQATCRRRVPARPCRTPVHTRQQTAQRHVACRKGCAGCPGARQGRARRHIMSRWPLKGGGGDGAGHTGRTQLSGQSSRRGGHPLDPQLLCGGANSSGSCSSSRRVDRRAGYRTSYPSSDSLSSSTSPPLLAGRPPGPRRPPAAGSCGCVGKRSAPLPSPPSECPSA